MSGYVNLAKSICTLVAKQVNANNSIIEVEPFFVTLTRVGPVIG